MPEKDENHRKNAAQDAGGEDYRNTPEGRETARKYADIIHRERPPLQHSRMAVLNRAKIFAPYDALRGFDEEIADEDVKRVRVPRENLSEEEFGELSDQLLQVKKGMVLTVTYFVPAFEQDPDPDAPEMGFYQFLTGTVRKIDPVYRVLEIDPAEQKRDGGTFEKTPPTEITFDDIYAITFSSPS